MRSRLRSEMARRWTISNWPYCQSCLLKACGCRSADQALCPPPPADSPGRLISRVALVDHVVRSRAGHGPRAPAVVRPHVLVILAECAKQVRARVAQGLVAQAVFGGAHPRR